ncbi:serine--tRNA ligase, partial [Wolbachia endosymbiont of Onchocerca gibsoni]|nr:serine--tRNA ligase [Wolbachia endosymbiont of Onchocerca gibsoni]
MLVVMQYMHDIRYIRKKPEEFEKIMRERGIKEFTVREVLEIDQE